MVFERDNWRHGLGNIRDQDSKTPCPIVDLEMIMTLKRRVLDALSTSMGFLEDFQNGGRKLCFIDVFHLLLSAANAGGSPGGAALRKLDVNLAFSPP